MDIIPTKSRVCGGFSTVLIFSASLLLMEMVEGLFRTQVVLNTKRAHAVLGYELRNVQD